MNKNDGDSDTWKSDNKSLFQEINGISSRNDTDFLSIWSAFHGNFFAKILRHHKFSNYSASASVSVFAPNRSKHRNKIINTQQILSLERRWIGREFSRHERRFKPCRAKDDSRKIRDRMFWIFDRIIGIFWHKIKIHEKSLTIQIYLRSNSQRFASDVCSKQVFVVQELQRSLHTRQIIFFRIRTTIKLSRTSL